MARTPPTAIMLLLVVVLAALASVSARSSPQCPNGCIIASVVHPNRTCKCVVPQCNNPEEQQQVEQALMTASTIRRKQIRRPRIAAFDCDFCNRAPNTYASFDDCYAADVAFQPIGESIKPALYPTLAAAAGAIDGDISAQQATCPPTTAAGCTDVSSFTRWETLHAGSTATRDVTINGNVVLHGCAQPSNTVTARTITVAPGATLVIGDGTLNFNFKRLVVNGTFQMGTPSCPIRSGITVTVPGGDETNGVDVDKAGTYDVHGFVQGLTWTRVAATVPAGSRIITLQEAVQWQAGNEIVLVTTTWKDELVNQNEMLTIASVSADGLTVTTQQTIKFNHYGGEYKAEVALLTRRILFTSDNSSSTSGIGPHTTMFGPNARITGAAFQRWGARNKPGRYSIHFHLAGDAPQAYIKNNAVYNSNWRCITVHGTNDVYLYGNVGFNVPGHCYYLEDGVEERNVLERNLAAYVHPIQTAGTSGGQQGTDRWQSAALFDPSDSGASGFYALNAYNTWLNNAASGGFSGFTFPHAPRAIKDHKNMKKADGFPFDPSERPFILFKGNTAHSTAYFWEHNAAVYVGGMLFYKIHPSNGQEKLFYNNGRGSIQAEPLCPDPNWPAGDDGNYKDCWVGSSRSTKSADGKSDGFLIMQDTLTALANVGVNSWGDRVEVYNLQAYDVSRSAQYLGQSFMKDSYIRINTTNSVNGWSQWPWSKSEYYWDHYVIKGFEWYDTSTTTILSNITFDNYKFVQFTTNPADDWWYYNTPSAFRMLSYWDQYKPDKTMMVTRDIKCTNCDLGTSCSNNFCPGNAFFRVEETYRGASWYFNWLDQDGSVVRHVQPNKPAGPYLITSQPDWWKLDDATSWKEPKFNNPWITPMPADEVAARVEMRVENNGNRFTVQSFEGQDITRVGYVSQFGDVSKRVVLTKTEGTTGVTGKIGWYTVWNTTQSGFHAPKRLELILFNVPVARAVLWASCWPAGTTFTISKKFAWSDCLNVNALARATSRDAVLAGNGENYWVDANNCLHLKLTDPGHPWAYTDKFERAGMYVQEPIRWYDLRYVITAAGTAMSCSNTHFCPLPGDPASRVPPAVPALPVQCKDNPPPNEPLCGAVKCQWNYWPGCTNTQIVSGQYCQATCGTCPAVVPTSPSPKPSPSPSPSPSPKPSPSPTAMTTNVALTAVWSASRARWTCTAVVTVANSITNAAVSAAAVTGRWQTYNDYTGYPYTATRNTNNKGNLTMVTSRLMTNATRGCRFSVMNVTKSGFVASGSMPSAKWTFWGSARRQKRQAQRAARRAAMQG